MDSVLGQLAIPKPTVSMTWNLLKRVPYGDALFSRMIGRMAPYTATIGCRVRDLDMGHSVVELTDRPAVRNHLNSLHAVALMNLGEVATGLAVLYSIDGRGRGIVKSLKMDYLQKARGTIRATCDVKVPGEIGKHDVTVEAFLRNEVGEVVAKAYATWKIEITG